MRIDVSELLKEIGRTFSLKDEIKPSYAEEGLILKEPVKIDIHLLNTGSSILLTGTVDTKIEAECVRCLKKFVVPLHVDLDEEFSRLPAGRQGKKRTSKPCGGEIQINEKDFVFALEDEHILDLEEVIRENLIMSLPLKPLCSKTCRGLSSKKEKRPSLDPRLAKLKDFK